MHACQFGLIAHSFFAWLVCKFSDLILIEKFPILCDNYVDIDFLSDVSKEGLFRVSGSKKRQEELKDLLDKEENVDFDSGRFTPHDVASVLKIFLGDLPEPLLTHAPQSAYFKVTGKLSPTFKSLFCQVSVNFK